MTCRPIRCRTIRHFDFYKNDHWWFGHVPIITGYDRNYGNCTGWMQGFGLFRLEYRRWM